VKTASAVPKIQKSPKKCLKTQYPMDFGVGPIECVCVCVVHGQVIKKQKIYIWVEVIRIIEHEKYFA
jgi:hypothetical protein